jgi:CBS domain containing-hemolysin-like protein
LSGFLLQQFNRIPSVGDELYYSNLKILIYRANEKSIQSVVFTKLRKSKVKA